MVELTASKKQEMVKKVHNASSYSIRKPICKTLGYNRNLLYYRYPKSDPSEGQLREKIETLCLQYPKYGYRRIRELLLRQGDTVSHRRVARLMKEANLSVSVKRVCQTTTSIEGTHPWVNRLKALQVCRVDQVWIGDITYVRELKSRFIYVCLLMDVFTRMIRGWNLSQHLTQSLTLKPLQAALHHSVCEIHPSDQGVQYLSNAYIATLQAQGVEISVAQRGCPWENGYAERLIRTLKEEEVHLNEYRSITEGREHIGHFMTQVYHQKRPHSALGYLTPMEFQRQNLP